MQRRIIAIVLVMVLILSVPFVVTASADSSGLCFTATNDNLLELDNMTAFVNGVPYVPAKAFSTFGIYYDYFDSSSTALLYTGTKQIFFELTTGNTKDSFGTTYSASAVFKYGQVYLPVPWMCKYFGLSYQYISGTGYGDVLRIKNGSEVLTDSLFFDAATFTMRTRYNDYFGKSDPASPTPSPTPSTNTQNDNASVSLCFIGLPSEKILDSFDDYALKACFFITAEEAAASPDIVRRIYGSGHSLGIYCKTDPERECETAAEIIFEAAQFRPTLITSPTAISQSIVEYAESNGFAYFRPVNEIPVGTKYSTVINSKLDDIKGYSSLFITLTEDTENYLPSVLSFVNSNKIRLLPLLEVSV
ncbi:MAG: hypothetical protein KBI01_09390 [Oscillospiraceae bacterium]|nr:hypothetical protein [Oscillospiraceae bacterium]